VAIRDQEGLARRVLRDDPHREAEVLKRRLHLVDQIGQEDRFGRRILADAAIGDPAGEIFGETAGFEMADRVRDGGIAPRVEAARRVSIRRHPGLLPQSSGFLNRSATFT